jgi:HEAT repeat protein
MSKTVILTLVGLLLVALAAIVWWPRLSPEQQATQILRELDSDPLLIPENPRDSSRLGEAVGELVAIGDEAVPALVRCLRENKCSRFAREAAWRTLYELGPRAHAAVPFLVESLQSNDMIVVAKAAVVLLQMGEAGRPAVPHLLAVIESGQADMYSLAALGAVATPDDEVLQALRRARADGDSEARAFATAALVRLRGDEGEIDRLREWLTSDDESTRNSAVGALGYLGPSAAPAVGDLQLRLSDPEPYIRANAAAALGDIGAAAATALPALERLRDAQGSGTEDAAEDAIWRIRQAQAARRPDR